ncbi:MAG: hypothetical protein IKN07_06865 [Lachnospiraceae bacterium]|nr:hypothetical protein [Lachnospiraceae bacterium]MBR3735585.1 hypothetical protein [Lachnospiraceae bacterium]
MFQAIAEKIRKNPIHFICLLITLGVSVFVLRSFIVRGMNEEADMRMTLANAAVKELAEDIANKQTLYDSKKSTRAIMQENPETFTQIRDIYFRGVSISGLLSEKSVSENSIEEQDDFLFMIEKMIPEEEKSTYYLLKVSLYDKYMP